MTEAEKKTDYLKVTVEVDINEGIMDVTKDAIVKTAEQIPEVIRGRQSEDKKIETRFQLYKCENFSRHKNHS